MKEEIRLDDMNSYSTVKESFNANWQYVKDLKEKQKAVFNSKSINGNPIRGFNKKYIGQPKFTEISFVKISSKDIPEMFQKDHAALNIDFLDRKRGLVDNSVYTVDQLADGRMIFSGYNRIHTYDGTKLKTFYVHSEFGKVRDFFEGSDGKMWIATTTGCFYFKQDRLFKLTNIHDGIWRCYEDSKGIIWLTSFTKGVYYFDNEGIYNLRYDSLFVECKSVAEDKHGNIFLSTPPGVFKFGKRDTLLYAFDKSKGQPEKLFYWNDKILMGRFGGGLHVLEEDGFHSVEMGIEDFSIYSFDTTRTGLWFGSYGGGITRLTKEWEYERYSAEHGLISNHGHKICADDYGNIWVGDINSGVSVFKESQLKLSNALANLGQIYDVKEVRDTSYLFFSVGTPKMICDGKLFELECNAEYDNPKYHRYGAVIHSNDFWMESFTRGPLRFNNNKLTFYKFTDTPQEANAHSPLKDKFGRVWLLNFRQNPSFIFNDKVYKFQESSDLAYKQISFCLKDKKNETYLIGLNEYYLVRKEKLLKFSLGDSSSEILYAFPAQNDGIWLVTNDKLLLVKLDRINEKYSIDLDYSTDILSGIDCDTALYFSSSNGIIQFQIKGNEVIEKYYAQSYGQHLLNPGVLSKIGESIIYSGSNFNYYLTENWNTETSKIGTINIKEVFVNQSKVELASDISLTQDDEIRFNIITHNWGSERTNYYRLLVKGSKQKFGSFNTGTLDFANLANGEYTLEIKTVNTAGHSKVESMDFYVQPYWYESLWFFISASIFLLLVVVLYFIRKIKKSRKLNLYLDNVVAEKTKELSEEKQHMEQQLFEKELLLKEINHRVKNNMQMVNSLLELQKARETNTENKESLTRVGQRVKALAIAHQHLYLQSQYESINMADYLTLLIDKLTLNLEVELDIKIDPDLMMPIEKGQALGLIVNELLSNSIKHVYPTLKEKLEIAIELKSNERQVFFNYSDNGQGFDNKDLSGNSLGFKLIDSFITRQLNGEYEVKSKDKYEINIKFEL